jgi:glycosyltransferase involved in cell wall biosynthesis
LTPVRILVATTVVPFTRGGAEQSADGIVDALNAAGHQAQLVTIPFGPTSAKHLADQTDAARKLALDAFGGLRIDRVIGLKFPAYLMPHRRKTIWLFHQHRPLYDQWCDRSLGENLCEWPGGKEVRDQVAEIDRAALAKAPRLLTLSGVIADRLRVHSGIDAPVLRLPPTNPGRFRPGPYGDYVFFPGRINPVKRQRLAVEALAHTRHPVVIRFAGASDVPGGERELAALATDLGVGDRVVWLGNLRDDGPELVEQYAGALAVLAPMLDEDYGLTPSEAMLAEKPVITCFDSGGTLESVVSGGTGLVVESTPQEIAAALDLLWESRGLAADLGRAGRAHYDALGISWDRVVETLLDTPSRRATRR